MQFVDSYEAAEAQRRMNGKLFAGREISVVVAAETRKRPEEMRHKARLRYSLSYRYKDKHAHTVSCYFSCLYLRGALFGM